MTTFTDDELAAFRAHDRLMAEAREQEQRDHDPNQDRDHEPETFTDKQTDAIAHVIVALRREWRGERDEAIAPLKAEIAELRDGIAKKLDAVAELRGKLDAVLTLLGQGERGKVIDVPNWRRHA